MRETMKKIKPLLVVIAVLIGALIVPMSNVNAETSGDYTYDVLDDGTAEITGYTGSAEKLTIPSSLDGHKVTSIGVDAFAYASFTSVTVPDTVTTIGAVAFAECMSLKTAKLPKGLKEISTSLFWGDASLTSVNIPSGVTSIGDYAFYMCNLSSISLPEGLKTIGDWAICGSFTSVKLPSTLTEIGDCAFNCSLKSIYIPASVKKIGGSAFQEISDSITVSSDNKYYSSKDGILYNKNKTEILRCPLNKTSVNIPSTVKIIAGYPSDGGGGGCFKGCTKLTSVTLPEGVTKIGSSAFSGCSSLKNINLPSTLKSIDSYAFSSCNSLKKIVIPSGVTSIQYGAFWNCKNLTSIKLPDGITSIAEGTFYNCTSLKSIVIPDNVESIGGGEVGAFGNCTSLKTVKLPEKLTTIDWYAFNECSSLTSINIPSRVEEIGMYAFYNCTSLKSVTIPSGVKNIDTRAFGYYNKNELKKVKGFKIYCYSGSAAQAYAKENGIKCKLLKTHKVDGCKYKITNEASDGSGTVILTKVVKKEEVVKVPNTVEIGGVKYKVTAIAKNAFKNDKEMKNLVIGKNVKLIGAGAFSGCSNLQTATIGKNVAIISKNAFSNCTSLKTLIIGKSVISIGKEAFYNCSALSDITIKTTGLKTKSIGKNAFGKTKKKVTVKVPKAVKSFYKKMLTKKGISKKAKIKTI